MIPILLALAAALLASCGQSKRPLPPGPDARVERVLHGHSKEVWKVAFTPDSQFLATASVDATVKIWRVIDGKLVRTLNHPAGVTSVAISPDGQWLATGSYDGQVRCWRFSDGTLVRTLSPSNKTVWTVAFSPDSQSLASAGEDQNVTLWNLSDGSRLRTLTGHTRNVWSIAYSPDGRTIASGSFDKTIKLWRLDGRLPVTLNGHSEAVVSVDFSPDGHLLASGGDDATVRFWNTGNGALIRTCKQSPYHVYAVAFDAGGRYLASGGRDRSAFGELVQNILGPRAGTARGDTIHLWRIADGELVQTLSAHANDVFGVQFSHDGKWLASASQDTTVILWRLAR